MDDLKVFQDRFKEIPDIDLLLWYAFGRIEGVLDANQTDLSKISRIQSIVVAFNVVEDQKVRSILACE